MSTKCVAIGFPSRMDALLFYPLSLLLTYQMERGTILEEQIIKEGRTILGKCPSYKAAVTLCNAWRRTDKQRRTMIVFVLSTTSI